MPSISIGRDRLCQLLGQSYTTEELSNILFDFGVELDDAYEENNKLVYKLDIGANRYDLLCGEGLANALRSYIRGERYKNIYNPSKLPLSSIIVEKRSTDERHEVACAVIRNINLSGETYESFISYQDKLHSSIGRNRSIVAIGTHDLEKLPSHRIIYESRNLSAIQFTPLNGTASISGDQLSSYLSKDKKLSKYFNLLRTPERSVVFESGSTILSIPPILNSNESKISPQSKDVFIEVTGTDFKKVNTALKMMIYNFAGKEVERVTIWDAEKGTEYVTPVFNQLMFKLQLKTVREKLNLKMTCETVKELLERMEYIARIEGEALIVEVLDVRSDVMHECDIIEDIAIAYGFNNFTKEFTEVYSVGREEPMTRFMNKIRTECALFGFNEVLTLTLLSGEENFIDSEKQVILSNPKSRECEVVRTSLLPGLLKSISVNQHVRLPIRIFEASDVVHLSDSTDEGAENKRRLCCAIAGNTSMLEEIHGPLSMLFKKCNLTNFKYGSSDTKYFLENQAAAVYVGETRIGEMGVIHPSICKEFNISYAVSAFEIDLDLLYKEFNAINKF